nr:hypothetical protein [Campylobacter sp.]
MNYDLLFSQNTLRIELMRLKENPNNKQIKIFIHRNHSFEMISSVLNKFFDFSQLKAEFKFSSYDDSLTFNNNLSGYDLHILWLNLSRYNKTNVKEFLNQKINELKSAQNAPILLGFINGDNFSIEISNVISLDIDKIVQ